VREDFLEIILAHRRMQVALDRKATNREGLRQKAALGRAGKSAHLLKRALRAEKVGTPIIAEFKRASPSLGEIRRDAAIGQMVALYQAGGARAISVLTEPEYFKGSLDDLREARAQTNLPILRKDFIVDELQIEEAVAAGADAILLIVSALSDEELLRFRMLAETELGLDALVEVHDAQEMERATSCGATLIGVNNRDLRTFATSLETSVELAALASPEITLVSESGISSRADIERLERCGFRGFLIGESLMRAIDPVAFLKSLRDA
jgi:indole-3-glycerol phosphate synthase